MPISPRQAHRAHLSLCQRARVKQRPRVNILDRFFPLRFPHDSWKRTDSSSGKVYCAASSEKMSVRIVGVIGLRPGDTTVGILPEYELGIPES